MALNTSRIDIVANRRLLVGRSRCRGLTQREICAALASAGHVDPRTGKSWSVATINSDLKALEAEWRTEAVKAIGEHKANLLAEVREVRRKAWADNDIEAVLKALKQERDLLGVDAPAKVAPTDPSGDHEYVGTRESAEQKLLAALAGVADARRARTHDSAGEPDDTGTGGDS